MIRHRPPYSMRQRNHRLSNISLALILASSVFCFPGECRARKLHHGGWQAAFIEKRGKFSGATKFDVERPSPFPLQVSDILHRQARAFPYSQQAQGTATDKESSANKGFSDRTSGFLTLLSVPLAWGTFEPATRYVYALDPPVPALVYTIGYYLVASTSLWLLTFFVKSKETKEKTETLGRPSTNSENAITGDQLPLIGGIELGTYLFLGNGFQVLGLKTVPSDRAAFLLQLTTILVPLVQGAFGRNLAIIPLRTWVACLIALSGVAVMGLDGQEVGTDKSTVSLLLDSFSNMTEGDIWIALAAFAYTFHCIRLGKYAREAEPVVLGAAKATTEASLSIGVLLFIMFVGGVADGDGPFASTVQAKNDILTFSTTLMETLESSASPPNILLPFVAPMVWTGLIGVAYTISAQSYGQRYVNPTDANLIYTIQPLFTAVFAWALLGETLGVAGYTGGALILLAVVLVAAADGDDSDDLFSSTKRTELMSASKTAE